MVIFFSIIRINLLVDSFCIYISYIYFSSLFSHFVVLTCFEIFSCLIGNSKSKIYKPLLRYPCLYLACFYIVRSKQGMVTNLLLAMPKATPCHAKGKAWHVNTPSYTTYMPVGQVQQVVWEEVAILRKQKRRFVSMDTCLSASKICQRSKQAMLSTHALSVSDTSTCATHTIQIKDLYGMYTQ